MCAVFLGAWPSGVLAAEILTDNSCICTLTTGTQTKKNINTIKKSGQEIFEEVSTFVKGCVIANESNVLGAPPVDGGGVGEAATFSALDCKLNFSTTVGAKVTYNEEVHFNPANIDPYNAWYAAFAATVNKTSEAPAVVEPKDASPSGAPADTDISLVPPNCRGAAPVSGDNACGLNAVEDLIIRVTKLILGLAGSLALLMFVYGGMEYILAGGIASRAAKGKSAITYAIIGLAIVLCARLILSSILRMLTGG